MPEKKAEKKVEEKKVEEKKTEKEPKAKGDKDAKIIETTKPISKPHSVTKVIEEYKHIQKTKSGQENPVIKHRLIGKKKL